MTYLRSSLELLQETRRATLLVVAHAARRYVRSTWNYPRRDPPMPIMQFLGLHGASLDAPKALLSSNLVPLSPPSSVKLPLLAPTCDLTRQLSLNFGLNLPSNLNFH